MRPRVEAKIREFIEQRPAGDPFVPAELLMHGTRASIDQALKRLTEQGLIQRAARGVYVRPRQNRIVGAVPPGALKVAHAYARGHHLRLVPHGAQVLADQGVTTQTPVRAVLGSEVPKPRTLNSGGQPVVLTSVPKYVLQFAGTREGELLSGLAYLGRKRSAEAQALLASTSNEEFQALLNTRPALPGWLADLLTRTARHRDAG